MISNTHTITIGRSKNGISRIVAISFSPEQKNTYLILCDSDENCRYCVQENICTHKYIEPDSLSRHRN